MTPGAAVRSTVEPDDIGNLVIIIGPDGTIRSVIGQPKGNSNSYPEVLDGRNIDEIWSAEIAQQLVRSCKLTLQSRQVHNLTATCDDLLKLYEFMLVAQDGDSVMLIVRDMSNTQRQIARLEQLAFEDPVTGLPNRSWLLGVIDRVLRRISQTEGRAAVISVEISQLDVIKDLESQEERDLLLRELAQRMKRGLRGANQADEQDDERYSAVARVDTNRFAITLPSIETGEDAEAVTTRIAKSLKEPVLIQGKEVIVKVAAGIALYPQDGRTGDELLRSSVTALHDAENSATWMQQINSDTVRLHAAQRQDLECELNFALANQEFALTYLPIVASDTRNVLTAEALLRWPTPLFREKPIDEVVAVAEYTGLILPIGEWIFRSACEQLAEWHRQGLTELSVAVNVSAHEFSLGDLVKRTRDILDETSVDSEKVVVEITEQVLLRDSADDYAVCRDFPKPRQQRQNSSRNRHSRRRRRAEPCRMRGDHCNGAYPEPGRHRRRR
jgi:diguanylate cyclase (GGDEF)-like protein